MKIWISVPRTLHIPGPHFSARIDTIGSYGVAAGNAEIIVCPENVPFEIDEATGRSLLEKFGGYEVMRNLKK